MQYLKKHWYLVIVTLLTIGLAIMVILTSGKLSQTKQVTPTESRAAASACVLTFNITIGTPTSTPTGTLTPTPTPTETLTPTPTPEDTSTPTPTPTPTGTPTPTPTPTGTPTPLPTPTPQIVYVTQPPAQIVYINNTPYPQQQVVYVNNTPYPQQQVAAACNGTCTINTDCTSGLVCIGGACRNPSCTSQTNCVCPVAAAPTPKIPVSGTGPSVLGASIIGGGLLILLLGLAL